MIIKNTASTSQKVNLTDSGSEVTVLPGQVVNVPEYDQAKEIMGMNSNFDEVVYSDDLRQTTVTITSAEVLALNTTPKAIVAAPGAGYGIRVEEVIASVEYVSAAYATNTQLEIHYDSTAGDAAGAEATTASIDALLTATADKAQAINGLGQAETNIVLNKGISAIVGTGDPVTGDSDIKITVFYRIVAV